VRSRCLASWWRVRDRAGWRPSVAFLRNQTSVGSCRIDVSRAGPCGKMVLTVPRPLDPKARVITGGTGLDRGRSWRGRMVTRTVSATCAHQPQGPLRPTVAAAIERPSHRARCGRPHRVVRVGDKGVAAHSLPTYPSSIRMTAVIHDRRGARRRVFSARGRPATLRSVHAAEIDGRGTARTHPAAADLSAFVLFSSAQPGSRFTR